MAYTRWVDARTKILLFNALLTVFLFTSCIDGFGEPAHPLSHLTQGQHISHFRVRNVYCDENRKVVGVKLEHLPTSAPVFFLQIETDPQVLMWIDTPVDSNQGLPHALEHLVAGKGTKGRYSTLLRDMRLSWSSAYTYEDHNFYSFLSGSGTDSFFEQLHAWLDTLYRPDFSDAEAKMEFYHLGVVTDSSTKKKTLIEKGTVYDEMQPRQGRDAYYYAANKQLFGDRSPFGFDASGIPDEMRGVTPALIRDFHKKNYHLGPTTGFIFVFDPKADFFEILKRISREFEPYSKSSPRMQSVGQFSSKRPKYPTRPASSTAIQVYPFPDSNDASPGQVFFSWPSVKNESAGDLKLLQLLMEGLAEGEQSSLYKALVDRITREFDSGATTVSARLSLENSPFFPIPRVWIAGIPGTQISKDSVERLRNVTLQELRSISEYVDGSEQLLAFDRMISSQARTDRRAQIVWTKSPPLFGLSDAAAQIAWKDHLQRLDLDQGFVRSLSEQPAWDFVDDELKSATNIWRRVIQQFHLLDAPYATASVPSRNMLEALGVDRHDRLARAAMELMRHYHVADEQEAFSALEREERMKSIEIERIGAAVARPSFTKHPPLTPDDSIRYRQFHLTETPVIASLFERPPTIDIGLSFDLGHIPRRYYKLLSLVPASLESLGLNKSGNIVRYSELRSRIRAAAYEFSVKYPSEPRSKIAHLEIRASASDIVSFRKTLVLIQEMMQDTFLDIGNVDRLRDIVTQNIVSDDLFLKQPETNWLEGLVHPLRRQDDPLFWAVHSHFTKSHCDARLAWLLHKPLEPEDIENLVQFGSKILTNSKGLSRDEWSQKLSLIAASGLQSELLEYWRANIFSFPEPKLTEGLRQLLVETEQDLRAGPAETIQRLRELQKIIFNRKALQVDLTMSGGDLKLLQPDLDRLLESIPAGAAQLNDSARSGTRPDLFDAKAPLAKAPYPWYFGLVEPGSINGDAVFFSDFPGYSQHYNKSLLKLLASNLLSGAGPASLYMKTWEAGLAYDNGVASFPDNRLLEYSADRSPDLAALVKFVLSEAKNVSNVDEHGLVDYAFSRIFSFSREMMSSSQRGRALARDLRDGITPEKMRSFSESMLRLRSDPQLLGELRRVGFNSICGVLPTRECAVQHQREHSIFFFLGSEDMLSDTEKSLTLPRLIRLYPSDYWIN